MVDIKIGFFHELIPLSGAKKVVDEYGKVLGKDHLVDLFYVDDKKDVNAPLIFNNVYHFKFKSSKLRFYRDSIELIRLYFLHKKITKIIKDNNYDFVFIGPSRFTQAPFLLGMVSNTLYFCQEPLRIAYDPIMKLPERLGFIKKNYEKINRFNRKLIDKSNMNKAKIVLANSNFTKQNIKNAYNLDSFICYLGVDTNKFKPLGLKKKYDLIFIGEKTIIEGYNLLEKTLMLFDKKPIVKYIIRNKKGEGITEEDLIKEINRSKIIVCLSRNEPFGLIPIEAMSCGVPVISLNEGGLRESILNNKTGFFVSADPKDIYKKINNLIKDHDLQEKLGKQAREYIVNNFTWEKSVNNFLKIVDKHL